MSFNREMANIMAGSGAKVIHGEIMGNVDPYIEWIKWLSYVPTFQQLRIKELNSKKIEDVSLEELDEIRNYKKQKRMSKLFRIYGSSDISKEEYMEVYNYMVNQSIDELMLSKLTSEELKYAREQIKYYSQISKEELRKKAKTEQKEDNYKKLSMVDSYILHMISKIDFSRSLVELDKSIEVQLHSNDVMRQKSLYYAANPQIKG